MGFDWIPHDSFVDDHSFLKHTSFDDFDAMAASLTTDVTFTQLTPGPFHGDMVSAFFGTSAVHLQHVGQTVEEETYASPTGLTLATAIDADDLSWSWGHLGIKRPQDCLYIVPPNIQVHFLHPAKSSLIFVCVDRTALVDQLEIAPDLADWMARLGDQCLALQTPTLARRVRMAGFQALEAATTARDAAGHRGVDRALVMVLASAFALEFAGTYPRSKVRMPKALERFQDLRARLREQMEDFEGSADGKRLLVNAQRADEKAFTKTVGMGPLAYSRVVRLHNTRRKLSDRTRLLSSIGDIAAEEGFWDWSRFSTYYRQQFGELPSETRARTEAQKPGRSIITALTPVG